MKLREIVANLIDSRDSSSHDFRRLYNLAVFGIRTEFSLDIKGYIKSVLLDVNPNKSVELPCNYISLSKIGIVNGRGEVVTFKRNNMLSNYHADQFTQNNRLAGVPLLPSFCAPGLGGVYGYNQFAYLNYWYGGTGYHLFGLGSGTANVGEYKIDEANRIILFNSHFIWDQVLLEYLSDGCDEDSDDYEIDVRYAEAVKAYIRWQDVIDRPKKASPGAIQQLKLAYFNSKRVAKMRINPVIINEMQNAERRSWKLVAKS